MKSIILYESKTGCTKKCAEYLKDKNEIEMNKLSEFKDNINVYDTLVLMSPVYMGRINKKVSKYIESNKNVILDMKLVIVLCCMNEDGYDEMLINNFSKEVLEHAEIIHAGGAYYLDRLNFFYRKIIKSIAKVDQTLEEIKYDNLDKIKI